MSDWAAALTMRTTVARIASDSFKSSSLDLKASPPHRAGVTDVPFAAASEPAAGVLRQSVYP